MSKVKAAVGRAAAGTKGVTVGFWKGLRYPFRGMAFVYIQHMDLVRIWIWPILLTLLALVGVFWSTWAYHEDVTAWLWTEPTGESFWDSVARFFHGFVEVLIFLLLLALGLVACVLLTTVFAAPFNDALSEKVESIVTGVEGPKFSVSVLLRDTFRTIALELAKIGLYLMVMIPMFALSFVPVIGPVLYAVAGFLFTTLYFAVDYIDWPASRRNRGIRYRFSLLGQHFLPMWGFGTGVWLFLFIPFVNLVFMPAAVAGGTLLYLDLEGGALDREAPPEPAA